MAINRFTIRVYGILFDENKRILVSDEFIRGDYFTKFPGGGLEIGEGTRDCLKREFKEETGVTPTGPFIALTPIKQKGGKIVHAWAFKGDCDPSAIVSNTFSMEWPPKSGRQMEFPEMDRADFFDVAAARRKIKAAQMALVEECEQIALGKPSRDN